MPPDDSLEGLDNLADVLGTSPALIERYIGAAAKISRLAVGDTDIQPLSITYKVRGDVSQDKHIEGLPLGTRGGIVIKHNFPVDGEYLFKFSLLKVNFGPQYGQSAKNEQLEMSVNGVRVLLLDLRSAPYYYIRGGAAGGPGAGSRDPAAGEGRTSDDPWSTSSREPPRTWTILCSHSMRRRPTCRRASSLDTRPCRTCRVSRSLGPITSAVPATRQAARKSLSAVPLRSATRLPARGESSQTWLGAPIAVRCRDDDIAPLMTFYQKGREAGDFDTGVEMALRRILADPLFVFRFERDPDSAARRRNAPHHRYRTGIAPVVLPLEQHSR